MNSIVPYTFAGLTHIGRILEPKLLWIFENSVEYLHGIVHLNKGIDMVKPENSHEFVETVIPSRYSRFDYILPSGAFYQLCLGHGCTDWSPVEGWNGEEYEIPCSDLI